MTIKCLFGFLTVNLANNIFNNGFHLIVSDSAGFRRRDIGSVTNDKNMIGFFSFQSKVVRFDKA